MRREVILPGDQLLATGGAIAFLPPEAARKDAPMGGELPMDPQRALLNQGEDDEMVRAGGPSPQFTPKAAPRLLLG